GIYSGGAGRVGRGGGGRRATLRREIALADPQLGFPVREEADVDLAPGAVGEALGRVGQQVMVVQLVRDAAEDADQLADLVGEEVGAPRLLGDVPQEAAGAAREQPRLAAEA